MPTAFHVYGKVNPITARRFSQPASYIISPIVRVVNTGHLITHTRAAIKSQLSSIEVSYIYRLIVID
jgi:hypothetical protein